ncbi:MAG: glyoxalase family protein [Solirubrobacteraceae bacterium]|nr:glyoxalase family protein [Solirubrobacteraceae bacterium]
MRLEGLHHVTAITADAPANLDFYTRILGLRMVKKTVNFDSPDVYHLYYGDDTGTPGSILTFFEFPNAARGTAGDGMIHRVVWRLASEEALAFWEARLRAERVPELHADNELYFSDHEGLAHELVVVASEDAPLVARADDIPPALAIQGLHAVRAFSRAPAASAGILEALRFASEGADAWRVAGEARHALYHYDAAPVERGIPGAGTVHHVAWSAADDAELEAFRHRVSSAGARPTPIIDRQYFHSVYFREPSGVLFELASRDVGFAVDEPVESLGEALKLPSQHEHLRAQLEQTLTPLT